MKILTVVFNLQKGGTQRAAQNFCEAYAALEHDSRLVTLEDGPRRKELEEERIKVWVGLSSKTKEEIKSWKPEIIHLHSLKLEAEDVYELRAICPDARFVETNVFSVPSEYSDILTYSYQLSEWCKYLYISRGGETSKCKIVPNPVKVRNFYKASLSDCGGFRKRYNIPFDAFLFGRIGQSYYGKWSLHLIDLFERFVKEVNSNTFLIIVNPPSEIIRYISEKGINEKVIIIDKLNSDEELRICYSSINVFLHIANQGESFGLVLAESLLCETPVITLNTPWGDNAQSEVVGHMVGGFCADTLPDFYAFMKSLFLDHNLIKKLGAGGRSHIISNYDYLIVAKNCIEDLEGELPEKIIFQPAAMQGIKNLKSPLRALIILLLRAKLHNERSHRLINFILKKMMNFDARSNYTIS